MGNKLYEHELMEVDALRKMAIEDLNKGRFWEARDNLVDMKEVLEDLLTLVRAKENPSGSNIKSN